MKIKRILQKLIIAFVGIFVLSLPALAQPSLKAGKKDDKPAAAKTVAAGPIVSPTPEAGVKNDPQTPEEVQEDAYITTMYTNSIMRDYKLGPEDVISVEVFGQCPNYCKMNVTVPPTGRISYPLIKEGVFVAGRTVEEVAEEVTKKLDEYIIEPKVQVTLDKAMSARYSVLGEVRSPGIKPMTRRISIYEAIGEAGGLAETGSKKNVVIIRMGTDGKLVTQNVNLGSIEKGKADMIFLSPGDQVVVQGNMMKKLDGVLKVFSIFSFARVFGGF
ncbi:MAG TPA: polysaccharide biosynthesis/export family protein [Pyrinomonadaceae bacterium]|jgi:polysaccharide export outer membrane protein|nr:polysaccharide biosynthesis/export family protein [Pyrinomonadaceae bacterium]